MARDFGKSVSRTNTKRPGRHAKSPNKNKKQSNAKPYRGQGRK